MNNEELTALAIEKAWIAEIGEENYNDIDKKSKHYRVDGFVYEIYIPQKFKSGLTSKRFYLEGNDYPFLYFRPKSLHRIEDNFGWTRIEPDGSNLPPDIDQSSQDEHILGFLSEDGKFSQGNKTVLSYRVAERFKKKTITHYRTVKEFEPPII